MTGAQPDRVRFGQFEFDLKTGELFVPAILRRTVLPDQLFCLLAMLVKHEGQLVTRDEIRGKFWPRDTIVDFDHSINVAVGKLRRALDDCADQPKYIETLARGRGYRLMVPVERVKATDNEPANKELSGQQWRFVHGDEP